MPMGPRNPILHNTRLCLFWSASIMGCCNGVAKDYPLSQQDLETQVGASNEMPKSPVTLQSAITLQNTNLRKQGCPTHSLPGCVMQLLATCVNYMMWNVRYSTYCNSHMLPASQATFTFVVLCQRMAGNPCNRIPVDGIKGPDHNDLSSLNVQNS